MIQIKASHLERFLDTRDECVENSYNVRSAYQVFVIDHN